MNNRATVLEINLNNLEHNYNIYKNVSSKNVIPIVKANAYGLGMVDIAKAFESIGASYLGTATFDEAIILREHNIMTNILVMGYTDLKDVQNALDKNITITITSLDEALKLSKLDVKNLKLHLKVNTSMNRLGLNNLDEVLEAIQLLEAKHNIEGIFTHYCCSDDASLLKDFKTFKDLVMNTKFKFKYVHASSSNSALTLDEDFTNCVRIGVGLYGGVQSHNLKEVSSLKTKVVSIRTLTTGDSVGYNSLYTTPQETLVATLPIGYGDGILRMDKDNQVVINNRRYNIVGNICMDQLMVEVDDHVSLGDDVEIFGENISIHDIAESRNTIYYEVITLLSNRVHRIYK